MRAHLAFPAALVLSVSALALAAGSTTDGKSSGLSHAQIRKISKLGKPVLPTYVPVHFKVKTIDYTDGYSITYSGPHGGELDVQMAEEGIGDIPLDSDKPNAKESTREVNNAVFGKRSMDVLTAPGDHQFAVNWVDLGERAKPRFLSIIGRGLSASEGAKVWKGLRYLKR